MCVIFVGGDLFNLLCADQYSFMCVRKCNKYSLTETMIDEPKYIAYIFKRAFKMFLLSNVKSSLFSACFYVELFLLKFCKIKSLSFPHLEEQNCFQVTF